MSPLERQPTNDKQRTSLSCILSFVLGSLFLFSSPAWAQLEKPWQLDLETGPIFVARNDVRVPRDSGTPVSLCRDSFFLSDIGISLRARLTYAVTNRHKLSLLAEPLSIISDGYLDSDLLFSGMVFPRDTPLQAIYRCDRYRLTYRYDFISRENLEAGIGLTAELRDAGITMSYDGGETTETNIGLVPLVNFRLNWMFNDFIGVLCEGDALPVSQGSTEDVTLAVLVQPRPNLKFRLGYRLLEGGTDVPQVYNSVLLHYIALGATISF